MCQALARIGQQRRRWRSVVSPVEFLDGVAETSDRYEIDACWAGHRASEPIVVARVRRSDVVEHVVELFEREPENRGNSRTQSGEGGRLAGLPAGDGRAIHTESFGQSFLAVSHRASALG
ncbi:hypothetical protein Ae263Ps1_1351c [Pseudonocardia sp. Ae263_Ps1]|nr:hypothetical protein Ae150APs1_3973 [Pseudonocardia sp. Ae150A_Ps1]OLL84296.1 hypothetical protein Ae263Ps1_1351c [Pseudonocardia sp. Ae263_Ps1]OLL95685.1 hypothetical protein Ae356Ps1_5582 [Pseudonocardia sp. Ae356_Ps1]